MFKKNKERELAVRARINQERESRINSRTERTHDLLGSIFNELREIKKALLIKELDPQTAKELNSIITPKSKKKPVVQKTSFTNTHFTVPQVNSEIKFPIVSKKPKSADKTKKKVLSKNAENLRKELDDLEYEKSIRFKISSKESVKKDPQAFTDTMIISAAKNIQAVRNFQLCSLNYVRELIGKTQLTLMLQGSSRCIG